MEKTVSKIDAAVVTNIFLTIIMLFHPIPYAQKQVHKYITHIKSESLKQ
jgi:hypothetical protein